MVVTVRALALPLITFHFSFPCLSSIVLVISD
jgi:hypothetical protein